MSWWEILIIIAASVFVIAVIAGSYIRKKQGKGGCSECGGNCAGCAGCHAARRTQKPEK